MAVTEQRVLPPEFIEAAGKTYLEDLSSATGGFKAADLSKVFGPQFVAGPGALQTQAEGLASGLGSFQPYLQTAAAQAGLAGQFMGPQAYQQFMSPFQKDVIDTTLSEFDRQAQKGITNIADQALAAGAFGGGREVYKEQSIKQHQIETELHYKHNYYLKVLVKHNKQQLKRLVNNKI